MFFAFLYNEKFTEQAMKELEENTLLAKDLTENEQKSRGITVINDIIWSDEEQKAFEELRDNLMKAPILIFPDFILMTDASKNAIGAVQWNHQLHGTYNEIRIKQINGDKEE